MHLCHAITGEITMWIEELFPYLKDPIKKRTKKFHENDIVVKDTEFLKTNPAIAQYNV
jgi:hypothetical protein